MTLWVAEYHRAFTGERRIALFRCPDNINPSFIAAEFKTSEEYVHKVENASQAMGIETSYIDVTHHNNQKKVFKSYSELKK